MQTTINDKFEYISIAMDDDCLSEEILDKLLADKGEYSHLQERRYPAQPFTDFLRMPRRTP